MVSRVIQARIPEEIRDQAVAIIESTGLTVSDVVRVLFTKIATDKALPLDIFQPSQETLKSLQDAQEGKVTKTTLNELRNLIRED